jgi:hypothetical protein
VKYKYAYLPLVLTCVLLGCQATTGNVGQMQSYAFDTLEPQWIRNGEPLLFEGEKWYPTDGIENLLDNEVYPVGEYRGVKFFVEKVDIRPYNRLYTKFGKNKFRYFEQKEDS